MQGMKKRGGRDLAFCQSVLGSTHLEQLQMHDHQSISTPHDVQLISGQAALTDARRLVAYSLASLSDKERQRAVGNLFPIDDTDIVECARQRIAAEMCDRFRFGVLVDSICWLWRWQLVGFNYFDPAPGTDIDLERGSHLEWLRPGDDDNVVRLVVGDEPQLLVSEDSGNVWTEISIGLLGDTLGDWLAARGAA